MTYMFHLSIYSTHPDISLKYGDLEEKQCLNILIESNNIKRVHKRLKNILVSKNFQILHRGSVESKEIFSKVQEEFRHFLSLKLKRHDDYAYFGKIVEFQLKKCTIGHIDDFIGDKE